VDQIALERLGRQIDSEAKARFPAGDALAALS
jgi:hypothetical protein